MRTSLQIIGGAIAGGAAVAAGVLFAPQLMTFVRATPGVILGWF